MKNILLSMLFAGSLLAGSSLQAGDDVYDEFTPKKQKVSKTQTPTAPQEAPAQYPNSGNSSQRTTPSFGDNYQSENYYEDDENNNTSFSSSYSERIQRFHNPSVGFNASIGGYYGGLSGYYNNNYYDPYYGSTGWYNPGYSQNYWFTPRSYWDYYNFWNPFSTTVVVITSPWQNNWGWCNDPWSGFGWNNNWYNSWYNPYYNPYNSWWTPTCHNIVYNNWGYDYGYRNTITTPRINTNTNSHNFSNPQRNSSNSNYQYNYNKPSNTGHNTNKQQKTITPNNNNNNNDSYYKPQQNNSNSNWNHQPANNNNSGSRQTESGIKVNKKTK